jgi:hypothetical protein
MEKTNIQVPGAVPSVDDQLSWLAEHLAQSRAFADCRGLFGYPMNHIIDTEPGQLKKRLGSIRIMTELVWKLKKKGWKAALYELRTALNSEHYTYAGEALSPEKTFPVTLVMYKPLETLAMLGWIFTNPLSQLNRFIGVSSGEISDHTRGLYEVFPTLGESSHARWMAREEEGQELWRAHKSEVLDEFDIPKRAIPMGLNWNYQEPIMATMENARGNRGMSHPFAFLVRGRDQKDVLELYSRTVQEMIATWQFHLPVIYKQVDTTRLLVGIHPEGEHGKWTKRYPSFASRGVTNGKGALVLPLQGSVEMYDYYVGDPAKYMGQPRIVLKRSSQCTWPWDENFEEERKLA